MSMNKKFLRHLISMHTKLTSSQLVPEIQLRLITPDCPLYRATPDQCPFSDPFWAFFWPGGQALTRYILDHPQMFFKKKILDVGSGCGASALACKMVGAGYVVANDIDQVAEIAIELNMEANNVDVVTDVTNRLLSTLSERFDYALMGDMFYDPDFTQVIFQWLFKNPQLSMLVGDPGRHSFQTHPLKNDLQKVADYLLPETCREENNGLVNGYVWILDRSKQNLK